jgi:hypothetical protein
MINPSRDSITLGPSAQSLSLPARQLLLAQYATKAQSGQLYHDPQWAAWGAEMRRRGMIAHASLGRPGVRPSPTFDDLMFPKATPLVTPYQAQMKDLVYRVPQDGMRDWRHRYMQLTDYKTQRAAHGRAINRHMPSSVLQRLKPLPYPKTSYPLNPAAIENAKNNVLPNHGKRPLTPKEKAYIAALQYNLTHPDPQGTRPFLHLDPNLGVVHGHDLLGGSKNFFAGWGDTLTDGATKYARKYLGQLLAGGDANTEVDYHSLGYHGGEAVGTAQQMLMGGAGGLKVAGKVAEKELAEKEVWRELRSLAKKLKLPEPIRKDIPEFSHFIPKKTLKRIGEHISDPRLKRWFQKTFGDSNWNGRYVSPVRHYMHDADRYLLGTGKRLKPGVERIPINKLPIGIQQIDRTPTVYRGVAAGAANGIGHHFGGREHRK